MQRAGLHHIDPSRTATVSPSLDWLDIDELAPTDGWLDARACVDIAPELFFRATEGLDEKPWAAAVAACARCVVAHQCLAVNLDMVHGYVGRTTPKQRRIVRRALAVAWRSA